MLKLKLHHWILVGFLLGIPFGLVFQNNTKEIEITYLLEGKTIKITEQIQNYSQIIIQKSETKYDTIFATTNNKLQNAFAKAKSLNREVILHIGNKVYENITEITKPKSIIQYFQPLGTLFLRLLSFLAIPLVISSLIVGVASIGDFKKLGRLGVRTIVLYIVTTSIAISIGLIAANLIQPGSTLGSESKAVLLEANKSEIEARLQEKAEFDILNFLVNIVPSNPFKAISSGEMLQIIFFAIFFGIGLTLLKDNLSQPIVSLLDAISEVFIKLVKIVLYLAPIGVFALIASAISEFGISIVSTLFGYMLTVFLGLISHFFTIYSFLLVTLAKTSPFAFLKGMKEAFIVAFSTSSSAATLPVTFECVEENLGVPKSISSFVLPLGATMNMDGTSLYQGVATLFIAQVYGLDLSFIQQLTILFTALMASIGTAPVPGVGLIMLIIVLQSVGIPTEGIALVLGVDRILDMMRTILNIAGDAVVSLCVWKMEKGDIAPSGSAK